MFQSAADHLACSSKPITEKKKKIVGCQLCNALVACTEVDYYASMEVSWRLHLILRGRGIMGCEHWGYPYPHWEQFFATGSILAILCCKLL